MAEKRGLALDLQSILKIKEMMLKPKKFIDSLAASGSDTVGMHCQTAGQQKL